MAYVEFYGKIKSNVFGSWKAKTLIQFWLTCWLKLELVNGLEIIKCLNLRRIHSLPWFLLVFAYPCLLCLCFCHLNSCRSLFCSILGSMLLKLELVNVFEIIKFLNLRRILSLPWFSLVSAYPYLLCLCFCHLNSCPGLFCSILSVMALKLE